MDDTALEAELRSRGAERHCELVVEQIAHGLWRAAYKTSRHPYDPDGWIRLSAARADRHEALRGLYDAGLPR